MKDLLKLTLMLFAVVVFAACNNATNEAATDQAADDATTEQATVAEEATPAQEEATEAEAAPAEEAAVDFSAGKAVFDKACMACHATGVAGAAKLDDKARWESTAAQGLNTVYEHSIKGFTGEHGTMPPKGGNVSLSDDDIKAAVDYMLHEAGVTAE